MCIFLMRRRILHCAISVNHFLVSWCQCGNSLSYPAISFPFSAVPTLLPKLLSGIAFQIEIASAIDSTLLALRYHYGTNTVALR